MFCIRERSELARIRGPPNSYDIERDRDSREAGSFEAGIGKTPVEREGEKEGKSLESVEFFFVERRRPSRLQSLSSCSLFALLSRSALSSNPQPGSPQAQQLSIDVMSASRRAVAALLARSRALLGEESRLTLSSSSPAASAAAFSSQPWPLVPVVSTSSSSISTPGTFSRCLSDIEMRGVAVTKGRERGEFPPITMRLAPHLFPSIDR